MGEDAEQLTWCEKCGYIECSCAEAEIMSTMQRLFHYIEDGQRYDRLELAEHFGVTESTIMSCMSRLVRGNLVEKLRDGRRITGWVGKQKSLFNAPTKRKT